MSEEKQILNSNLLPLNDKEIEYLKNRNINYE